MSETLVVAVCIWSRITASSLVSLRNDRKKMFGGTFCWQNCTLVTVRAPCDLAALPRMQGLSCLTDDIVFLNVASTLLSGWVDDMRRNSPCRLLLLPCCSTERGMQWQQARSAQCFVQISPHLMSCVFCGIPRAPRCPRPVRCEENKMCGHFPKASRCLPHLGALVEFLL